MECNGPCRSEGHDLTFLSFVKVAVDLQGCLPENRLYARPLSQNHKNA